ncbi:MAG TPA: zinc ribbon domain-containing protein [Solirubrobacteraceae bacterium]|jgi:hypothetical protein
MSVASTARFCPSCAAARQADERFCANCGAAFPDAPAAAAPAAPPVPAVSAKPATKTLPPVMMPPGTVPPAAYEPGRQPAQAAPLRSGKRPPWAIVAGVAGLLAVAGTITAVLLLGSAGQSFDDGYRTALGDFGDANVSLSRSFGTLERSADRSREASAAADARRELDAVSRRLAALPATGGEDEQLNAAMIAVAAEIAWLEDIERDGVTGRATELALDRINRLLSGLRPPVTPIDANAVLD